MLSIFYNNRGKTVGKSVLATLEVTLKIDRLIAATWAMWALEHGLFTTLIALVLL